METICNTIYSGDNLLEFILSLVRLNENLFYFIFSHCSLPSPPAIVKLSKSFSFCKCHFDFDCHSLRYRLSKTNNHHNTNTSKFKMKKIYKKEQISTSTPS